MMDTVKIIKRGRFVDFMRDTTNFSGKCYRYNHKECTGRMTVSSIEECECKCHKHAKGDKV